MKIKLFILISILNMISTSYANVGFRYLEGSFYNIRGSVANSCDIPRLNRYGQCFQQCAVAQWRSFNGMRFGYIQIATPYGLRWEQRRVYGQWWYYTWAWNTFPSNACFRY